MLKHITHIQVVEDKNEFFHTIVPRLGEQREIDNEMYNFSIAIMKVGVSDLENIEEHKITTEQEMEDNLVKFFVNNLNLNETNNYFLQYSNNIAKTTRRGTANFAILNKDNELYDIIIKELNNFSFNIIENDNIPKDEIIIGYNGTSDSHDSGVLLIQCDDTYYIGFNPLPRGICSGKDYYVRLKTNKDMFSYKEVA